MTAARSAIEAAATARAAVGFAIAVPPVATVARSVNFRDYGGSSVAYALLKIVIDVSSFADRLQSPRVRWTIAIVAMLQVFLGFLVLRRRLSKGSLRGAGSEQRVSITAVTREFLLPLAVGFEVVGWRVVWIEGPRNGFIHVVLNRGRDFSSAYRASAGDDGAGSGLCWALCAVQHGPRAISWRRDASHARDGRAPSCEDEPAARA